MGGGHEFAADLAQVRDRLAVVVDITTGTVIEGSADPDSMGRAYAAIDGHVPSDVGRDSLRRALEAEGMDRATIDSIDALYVRCLLDPTL